MNSEERGKNREKEERRRISAVVRRDPAKHGAMMHRHLSRVLLTLMKDAKRPEAAFDYVRVYCDEEVVKHIKAMAKCISEKLDDMPESGYRDDAIVDWQQIELFLKTKTVK